MEEQKDIFDFLEKRTPNVPSDDYFAELANKVLRENPSVSPKPKVVPLYRRPVFWVASAAAAVLLIVLLQPKTTEITQSGVDFNDLSRGEILAYVEYNLDEFDEELLAEFIPDSRMHYTMTTEKLSIEPEEKTAGQPSPKLTNSLDDISTDEILDYLEDEGMDLDDLDDDIFN